MADNEVGKIEAEVGMKTDDVEKGVDEVNSMITSLVKKVEQMGESLRGFFRDLVPKDPVKIEAPKVEEPEIPEPQGIDDETAETVEAYSAELRDAERSANALNLEMGRIAHASEMGFRNYGQVLKYSESIQQADQSVANAREQLSELSEVLLPTEDYASLQQAIEKTDQELTKLHSRQELLKESGIEEKVELWAELSDKIAKAEAQARQLESRQKELSAPSTVPVDPDEYAGLSQKIADANKELADLVAQQNELKASGITSAASQWAKLASQIEKAEEDARYLAEQKEKMENSGSAFINPEDTAQYQTLASAIAEAEQRLDTSRRLIDEEAIAQARLNVVTAQEAVAAAQTTREREAAIQQLQAMQNQLAYTANQNVTPKPDPEALTSWEAFKETVKGAGSTILRAIGRDALRAFSALKSGLKKTVGWFKSLRSHASSAGGSMQGLARTLTSLKTMLIGRIKRTFITQIVNAAKEGIDALAQFDSKVDRSISGVKNSFKEAGMNLSVTLGSLIQSISPIIVTMLDTVSAAVTKLNALIAMLRGQKTVTVAKRQNESYAASLNGAAGAANKAAAAQKKYNAALTSYDELHKLSDNSDNADTGAGGVADIFENVPLESILGKIPNRVIDFVQQIKDAINEGNWYSVGDLVAKGLNGIITGLDRFIRRVGPKCRSAALALSQGLNGFTDGFNFEGLGTTIGDGVNLIFSTVDTLVANTNWGTLGEKIASGINSLADGVNWEGIGQTISDGIDGAVDFIYGAIDKANWKGYGKNLGEAVNKFIDNTNFDKAGKTLGEAVKGILTSITAFLEEVDWTDLGGQIGDFIAGIDWGGVVEKIVTAIITVKISVLQLLFGFGKKIIGKIYDAVVEEAKSLGFDIEGENIVLGILHGIGAALVGIFEWVKNHIFMPILNAIKKAFGINSPAKEMEPLGDNIAGGILEGILSGAKAIFDWVLDLPGKIFDLLTGALGTVVSAGGKIVGSIKEGITGAWGSLKAMLSGKWDGIGSFLGGIGENLIAAGGKLVNFIKEGVNKAWGGFKSFVGGLWDGLKGVFTDSSLAGVAHETLGQAFGGGGGSWGDAANSAAAAGAAAAGGFAAGIASGQTSIEKAAGSAAMWSVDAVKRRLGIASPSKVFAEIGEYIDAGLVEGINSGKQTAISTTAGMAKTLTDAMRDNLAAETVSMELDGKVIDASADGIFARADAIGAGLDVITEKLAAIADRFAGIQIAMPEPALGTVIPARARIASAEYSTADKAEQTNITKMLSDLIALLTEQQARGREISITVPVQLDRNQIGLANARYNLSGQRITNGGLR